MRNISYRDIWRGPLLTNQGRNPNHWYFDGDRHHWSHKKESCNALQAKRHSICIFTFQAVPKRNFISEALCNPTPTVDKIYCEDSLFCSSKKSNWFQKQSYMTNGLIVLLELESLTELFFIIILEKDLKITLPSHVGWSGNVENKGWSEKVSYFIGFIICY